MARTLKVTTKTERKRLQEVQRLKRIDYRFYKAKAVSDAYVRRRQFRCTFDTVVNDSSTRKWTDDLPDGVTVNYSRTNVNGNVLPCQLVGTVNQMDRRMVVQAIKLGRIGLLVLCIKRELRAERRKYLGTPFIE